MVRKCLTAAAVSALLVFPATVQAEDNAAGGAAAGAAVGGVTGAIVGGPIGAAVGAGVGGTVGAGAAQERRDREVVIEHERRPVRERDCVRDSFGNVTCREIRR